MKGTDTTVSHRPVKEHLDRLHLYNLSSTTFRPAVINYAQCSTPGVSVLILAHEELTIESVKQVYIDHVSSTYWTISPATFPLPPSTTPSAFAPGANIVTLAHAGRHISQI
jgi:hypothetical protein